MGACGDDVDPLPPMWRVEPSPVLVAHGRSLRPDQHDQVIVLRFDSGRLAPKAETSSTSVGGSM